MSYMVHSHTESVTVETLKEAQEIAQSMAEIFGSSYITDDNEKVVDTF